MQIYNVYQSGKRLYIDEKEIPDNKIVVNKYDNMQQTLRLISDGTLPPRLYWALRNPKLSNKYFILKLIDNQDLIVGTDISATPGLWDMLLIGTDEDYIIEGADIDQSRLTYVSDHFGRLFVRDNFLEELDFEEQCSPTFKVFYDEIMLQLDNIPDVGDIPDKMSDLENDMNFISGVALKDDGEGNVEIIGTTFSGGETEEGGGGNYNLPVATENQLGGVKPLNKTEDMTQEVGVDKDGRLFAKGKDIIVDSELDKESQNPVQNAVITKEVIALRERNAELEETVEKLQIKTTTEPSPFHHITDSANMKVVDFGMEGITEQDTVAGNQLFDINGDINKAYNGTDSNKTANTVEEGILTTTGENMLQKAYGQCFTNLNGKTITIAAKCVSLGTNTKGALITIVENGTFKQNIIFEKVNTILSAQHTVTSDNLVIMFANIDGTGAQFTDIKVYEGSYTISNIPEWEPYTNGPSPNPDYKQEIKNAGKYNEETGRYEIGFHICGDNHFDINRALDVNEYVLKDFSQFLTSNVKTRQVIPIISKPNTAYHVERDKSDGATANLCVYSSIQYASLLNASRDIKTGDDGMLYVGFSSLTNKAEGQVELFSSGQYTDIRINEGSVLPFQEYYGKQFTLTSPVPITKWDKLVKRDGVWGWSIYHKHYIFDGSEIWSAYGNRSGFSIAVILPESRNGAYGYANWLYVNGSHKKDILILGMSNQHIYATYSSFYDSALSDKGLANWKAYLAENPLEVWTYSKDTEQAFHPLPDEEQTLLNNLEMYYGVTNVYNEQGCPMWLCYTCDSKLYVDQKLEQINNALLSLGANV